MVATFQCGACDHSQNVPDGFIGKSTRCPKCGVRVVIQGGSVPAVIVTDEVPPSGRELKPIVQRSSGGSIRTNVGPGIVVNQYSSLVREWITISDPRFPMTLAANTGITTKYDSGSDYSPAQYLYVAKFVVFCTEDVQACDVRFLIFDVWGRHDRTLNAVQIHDMGRGIPHTFEVSWNLYSENEAAAYYASIAYVAQIRTATGKVLQADVTCVLDEAKRFSEKFCEEDLLPTPPKSR